MTSTVIAMFDEYGQAHSAMNALFAEGYAPSNVKLSPAENSVEARAAALHGTQQTDAETSRGWSIGNFFRSLFGSDQHSTDADLYTEAVRRGSYLISVTVSTSEQGDRAAAIMQVFDPVDLEQRAAEWRSTGWDGISSTHTEARLPAIEKEIKAATHSVLDGGVRMYHHLTGKSVEEEPQTASEVENQSPQKTASSQMLDEDIFRQHFQTAYGNSGDRYEDYAPAYSYGATLANNQRYQGYRWEELEPQVRAEWETSHAGSPWERTRQAIRYGWEKMSSH
jgi:hypothetical protein